MFRNKTINYLINEVSRFTRQLTIIILFILIILIILVCGYLLVICWFFAGYLLVICWLNILINIIITDC